MKDVPNVFWARELKEWDVQSRGPLGIWHMARPIGFRGLHLFKRLRIAWKVFKGEYDALRWSDL